MDNPVKRIRKENGRTLAQFAGDIGCHWQTVYLCEQGVFPHILPTIKEYLRTLSDDLLDVEYVAFVHEKRMLWGYTNGASLFSIDDLGPPVENPIVALRERFGMSRLGFCKAICVHPAHELDCERGDTVVMPEQLQEALIAVGFSTEVIGELNSRLREQHEMRV